MVLHCVKYEKGQLEREVPSYFLTLTYMTNCNMGGVIMELSPEILTHAHPLVLRLESGFHTLDPPSTLLPLLEGQQWNEVQFIYDQTCTLFEASLLMPLQ